jgi:Mitochondrial carrier protein
VHMLASLAAGTVATTVCAPADVLKSRLQSSSSLSGKRSVRPEQHDQDMVADAAAGGLESPARVFAGGGPVLLDARMDASVAQTDVGYFSVSNVLLLIISSGQTPC